MPRKAKIALFLFLVLIAATVSSSAASPPLAGKLVYLQGQVEVRGEGREWEAARLNQELWAGDEVRTGVLSRAAILCVDESQLKLNENTVMALKSAAPSPRLSLGQVVPAAVKEAAASLYRVSQGEVWLRNKNEKFRFELETPAVTAAIRGTEFNLKVALDGLTLLTLLEGGLRLINPYGQLDLKPGEEGSARPGQPPTKRVLVQPADAVQWSLYYPGIFSSRDLPLALPEAAAQPAPASRAAALVRQGETYYDQGHLTQARQEAQAALQLDPENDRALALMGSGSACRTMPWKRPKPTSAGCAVRMTGLSSDWRWFATVGGTFQGHTTSAILPGKSSVPPF